MKTVREFFAGAAYVGQGLKMWARSPGLLALGIIPAVIAAFILLTLLILFFTQLGSAVNYFTGFTEGWQPEVREAVELLTGILLAGASIVVVIITFTALTLLIGDPFYEKISERVEDLCGGAPQEVDEPWYLSLGRSIVDSLRLIAKAVLLGIVLFPLSFIPVIGQTVVPVLGALIGGWFLVVELTAVTFSRRGIRLRERRRILAGRRAFSVGFGATVFVLFLIPMGAVLMTPVAVAGATQLARELLGDNSRPLPPSRADV